MPGVCCMPPDRGMLVPLDPVPWPRHDGIPDVANAAVPRLGACSTEQPARVEVRLQFRPTASHLPVPSDAGTEVRWKTTPPRAAGRRASGSRPVDLPLLGFFWPSSRRKERWTLPAARSADHGDEIHRIGNFQVEVFQDHVVVRIAAQGRYESRCTHINALPWVQPAGNSPANAFQFAGPM